MLPLRPFRRETRRPADQKATEPMNDASLSAALPASPSDRACFARSTGLARRRENFTGLQIGGDQPIAIESNQLDVDDRNAVATFSGNVSVAQGETL